MSAKQQAILSHLAAAREITTAQAVELIGRNLYANRAKHVGALLGNMLKRRMLVRVRRGVFAKVCPSNHPAQREDGWKECRTCGLPLFDQAQPAAGEARS